MNRYGLAALVALGCNGADQEPTGDRVDIILGLGPDVTNGETVFLDYCMLCHNADGTGNPALGYPDITTQTDQRAVVEIVIDGKGDMTPFGDLLTDQEIADVSGYVVSGELGG